MSVRQSILCPVDFSDASAGALRYAVAIAGHFDARLILLTVEDPLLTEAVDLGTGRAWTPADSEDELTRFVVRTLGRAPSSAPGFEYEVAVGKPAAEILRVSRERSCGLIVISAHGLTGMRRMFFGSITERVLRETTVPVLVTPPAAPGPLDLENVQSLARRILVPIDLSPASLPLAAVARRLAEALGVPLLLAHVIEPVKSPLAARLQLASIESDRRAIAEDRLNELTAMLPPSLHAEGLVAYGDPAEELVKLAHDRHVGLIVIGLQGSPLLGPHVGSVTFRVLCLASTLVLALPPGQIDGA